MPAGDRLAPLLARAVQRRLLMREGGGSQAASATPATTAEDDLGPLDFEAFRINMALAARTLPEAPTLRLHSQRGLPRLGMERAPPGISMFADSEVVPRTVLEVIEAVMNDKPLGRPGPNTGPEASTAYKVLQEVIFRARDVLRWRTHGCIEEEGGEASWVRPAPPGAVAVFLGLLPPQAKVLGGRRYKDRPDLAPEGLPRLSIDSGGEVDARGLGHRLGPLPPPDPALSSPEAHRLATHILARLRLARPRAYAGPLAPQRLAGAGQVAEVWRNPERHALAHFLTSGIGKGDELTERIAAVIAGRLDDVVRWQASGVVVGGRHLCPPPPGWMATMLLIGPHAQDAYARQRGARILAAAGGSADG